MNAPRAEGRAHELFSACYRELMEKAEGLPAPWVIDLMDGELRCLEHVIFEHGLGCECCADGVGPIAAGSFSNWPADWRCPLTLVLTAGNGSILIMESEESKCWD